jgi:tetratricopeptide (TPR) repeat protein
MRYLPFYIIFLFLIACEGKYPGIIDKRLLSLAAHKNNKDSVLALCNLLVQKTIETDKKDLKASYLKLGFDVSDSLESYKLLFCTELLKNDFKGDYTKKVLTKLVSSMASNGRTELSAVFNHSLNQYFKENIINNKIGEIKIDDDWFKNLGLEIFSSRDSTQLDNEKALKFVDICEAFAMSHPGEPRSADLLYQGAEAARILKTDQKAIYLYEDLAKNYPTHPKAGNALFLKGFILDNTFDNKEAAEKVYKDFLKIYPNHERSRDVKFLLENLYIADEDLFKDKSEQ